MADLNQVQLLILMHAEVERLIEWNCLPSAELMRLAAQEIRRLSASTRAESGDEV